MVLALREALVHDWFQSNNLVVGTIDLVSMCHKQLLTMNGNFPHTNSHLETGGHCIDTFSVKADTSLQIIICNYIYNKKYELLAEFLPDT